MLLLFVAGTGNYFHLSHREVRGGSAGRGGAGGIFRAADPVVLAGLELRRITRELIGLSRVVGDGEAAGRTGDAALDALRTMVGPHRLFLLRRVGLLAGWLIGL